MWDDRRDDSVAWSWFENESPISAKGRFTLAKALLARGDRANAERLVREAWRSDPMSEDTENNALDQFGALLTPGDHKARMDLFLYGSDYGAALRAAKRYSDYLVDRARQLFPARTAEAKVSSVNFLLPHIRRMPNALHRGEFINDAAQKLGIDSALLLHEVKMAAAQRTASIPSHRAEPLTETERILLRALVLPESNPARIVASTSLAEHPEWIADLATADLLDALAHAPAPPNPLDAASSDEMRAHLAHALADESSTQAEPTTRSAAAPSMTDQVQGALHNLEHRRLERRQRELRTQIAEADRRGDQEMLNQLIAAKLDIDRELRNH